MKDFEVTIKIKANDVMQSTLIKEGLQNLVDELGEHQTFLVEISDKTVAHAYGKQVKSFLSNKIFASFLGGK